MENKKDIFQMLDKAREMEIEEVTLNFKDKFLVAPQVAEGKSVWAKWLREGVIDSYHALWVFRDTNPKKWLAIRVEIPFRDFYFSARGKNNSSNIFYFNLQNYRDRVKLRQLEEELAVYLKKSQ